jgi:RHS repeat-associated protein
VGLVAETAHPLDNNSASIQTLGAMEQPTGTSPLANHATSVRMRAMFHRVDLTAGQVDVVDAALGTVLASVSGTDRGRTWSDWVTPSTGRASVRLAWPGGQANTTSQGVVLEGYEYQRYQAGSQPFWTPLRFPGQYRDTETDLFENWNRYYDPSIGRYLQPEPMHQGPNWLLGVSRKGFSPPVYSYAGGNPLARIDSDGRDAYIIRSPGSGLIEHWGVAIELYCHSENTCDPKRPVQRYDYSCSKIYTSTWECVFSAPEGSFFDANPRVKPLEDVLLPTNTVEVVPLDCQDTAAAVERVCGQLRSTSRYNMLFNNCRHFVWNVIHGPVDTGFEATWP